MTRGSNQPTPTGPVISSPRTPARYALPVAAGISLAGIFGGLAVRGYKIEQNPQCFDSVQGAHDAVQSPHCDDVHKAIDAANVVTGISASALVATGALAGARSLSRNGAHGAARRLGTYLGLNDDPLDPPRVDGPTGGPTGVARPFDR